MVPAILRPCFFMCLLLSLCFQTSAAPSGQGNFQELSPEKAGKILTENLLSRDYMFYGEYGLHYSEACAAVGALRYVTLSGETELLNQLIARYEPLMNDSSELVSRRPHVDMNVVGIVPLQIYMINKDERYLKQGLTFANSQWKNPRKDGLTDQTRWWIDDMYMIGMLQIQAYRATDEIKYADRAARQMIAYLDSLQQENGLFFHGPQSPHFWGRGNGWVAAALAEVLDGLPEDHPMKPAVLKYYIRMMQALLNYQSDNGMWRQLVDYPYAWAESSCTAMFAYAMAVGVHRGWLDDSLFDPAVEKAWKALQAHIEREGNIREICVGTGQQDDIEYYLKRPRHDGDFHGQAPVLWLIAEMMANGKHIR